MNKIEFQDVVRQASSIITSADAEGWTEQNPLWGHCAVVALLAQDYFGGTILRASLEGTPFHESSSHYRNEAFDFTEEQFAGNTPDLTYEIRTREYLLSNEDTGLRYQLLKAAFEQLLNN